MKSYYSLIALWLFLIGPYFLQAQNITITQPNGGEILYVCDQYTIKWNQNGSPSNYWNIDYSLDDGLNWTSVASNYLSTNGEYLWTIPDANSSTVKIRVRDANNNSNQDISDAVFDVRPVVVLTKPLGGEVYKADSVVTITWTNEPVSSGTYGIKLYEGNNHVKTIASGVTGNSYAWIVSNYNSSNLKIRIYDTQTPCREDFSTDFTITPKTPVITYPSAYTQFYGKETVTITWDPASLYESYARLEYSLDSGLTWNTITSNTYNDGSYDWQTPAENEKNCMLRIRNKTNSQLYGYSDTTFQILTYKFITPHGHDTLYGCTKETITWDQSGYVGYSKLYYSLDSGDTWEHISNFSGTGIKTYDWTPPGDETTDDLLFMLQSSQYTYIRRRSDSTFTLLPSNHITLTYPNGGEVFTADDLINITWTNLPDVSGTYRIELYKDGNFNKTITANTTGNSHTWTVTNNNDQDFKIKISDAQSSCKDDFSDAEFTITPKVPVITYPNAYTKFYGKETVTITWDPTTLYESYAQLEYSLDSGATWNTIASSTQNDGSFDWQTPTVNKEKCMLRISNQLDNLLYGYSDTTFQILTYKFITPHGHDTLYGCTKETITWEQSGHVGYSKLYYSLDSGATWEHISNFSGTGIKTYDWTPPGDETTDDLLLMLQSSQSAYIRRNSDSTFTLLPSNHITLTFPNGGEVFAADDVINITWTNLPDVSGTYRIELYKDGNFNKTITANATGNAYTWTVTNNNDQDFKIKIRDAQSSCKDDLSDAEFTITPKVPVITYPNAYTKFYGKETVTITWDPSSIYETYARLEYSLDSGATWNTIASSTQNDGSFDWQTPTVNKEKCMLRISNRLDNLLYGYSDTTFQILTYKFITPHGHDTLYGCTKETLTWEQSGHVGYSKLYYSLDSGATWEHISNFSGTGIKTYDWTPPGDETTDDLMLLLQSSQYTYIKRKSDSTFTLLPSNHIALTYPNGGEILAADDVINITWTNLPVVSGTYRIELYKDGNFNKTITANATGNAYSWTVTNNNDQDFKIKIRDAQSYCKDDFSDAEFTITPKAPLITYPNAYTKFYGKETVTITWDPTTLHESYARLEYSLDSGATWSTITSNTYNDGNYDWQTPTVNEKKCLLRISNRLDNLLYGYSDTTFQILTYKFITPHGHDTLYGCTKATITWEQSGHVGYGRLYYSLDSGATWEYINSFSGTGIQTYDWTPPGDEVTDDLLFKLQSSQSAYTRRKSDSTFTLLPGNHITLTYPNGGEVFAADDVINITWTNLPDVSGTYRIDLYKDGNYDENITTNATGNSYSWTVTNNNGQDFKIKISDTQSPCKDDFSDAEFTITPKVPVITYPNAYTKFYGKETVTITWDPTTLYESYARLEYSLDSGATWSTIASNTYNDGNYDWQTPTVNKEKCMLRISSRYDSQLYGYSDTTFQILTYKFITPHGHDTLYGCTKETISWEQSGHVGYGRLHYSLDSGATWEYINSFSGTGIQTYDWTPPGDEVTDDLLFKLQSSQSAYTRRKSDSTFTLLPGNHITLTYPNGGEVFAADDVINITWTNLPDVSGTYRIDLYKDGNYDENITTNATGNSYAWIVSNKKDQNFEVKISDAQNSCKDDFSDAKFSITPKSPLLTSPNGGEVLWAGYDHTITWDPASIYDPGTNYSVKLQYSTDSGATWNTITSSTYNDGSYDWPIPDLYSTKCLVKVSARFDNSVFDVSDSLFTINPYVRILTPNGTESFTWGGCTQTSITFVRSLKYNAYKFYYSTNNGASWNTISNYWSTNDQTATFNWDIPNVPGNQTRVKIVVYGYQNSSKNDISDAPFTVTEPVKLIQPNIGGVLQAGSNYEIKWTSDGISNVYDLSYSTDGGNTYTSIVSNYSTSQNTYNWTVPNTISTNCKIKIADYTNSCKWVESANAFEINNTPAPITLTYPNGQDTLRGCHTYTIAWTENVSIPTYRLEYSTDGGISWTDIVQSYANSSQTYDWLVPKDLQSNQAVIRVSSATNSGINDMSNAAFDLIAGKLSASPQITSVCSVTPIQLQASGGVNYQWTPATGLSAPNIANPIATPTDTTSYVVKSINGGCVLSDTITINVANGLQNVTCAISSNSGNSICQGSSVTFTATTQYEGDNPVYQWRINDTHTGVNSPVFSTTALQDGDKVSCILTSNLPCTSNNPDTSNVITMSVQSNTPGISINASSTSICSGTNVIFTAAATNGGNAPSYQWYVNEVASGNNSNLFTSTSLRDSDSVYVVLHSNETCLTSTSATSNKVYVSVDTIPLAPTSISGNQEVCANTTEAYSCSAVSNATSYIWSYPTGWIGNPNQFTTTVNTSTQSGSIEVKASNHCGNSTAQSLHVEVIPVPAQVALIKGEDSICSGAPHLFTLDSVSHATSYTWVLPAGWQGSSTDDSITLTANSNSGTLTVSANNQCGSSSSQNLYIESLSAPVLSSLLGEDTICAGTNNLYTIPVSGWTESYHWTYPTTWSALVDEDSITLTPDFSSGQLLVYASNRCGNSSTQSIAIHSNFAPATPGAISGSDLVCATTQENYSIASTDRAKTYNWSLPSGWTGTSTSTTLPTTTGSLGGSISVSAQNECGISNTNTLDIRIRTLPTTVTSILGEDTVCKGSQYLFHTNADTNVSAYTWTLPATWTGTGTDDSIYIDFTSQSDTLKVSAQNSCGSSSETALPIVVLDIPANLSLTGEDSLCVGDAKIYKLMVDGFAESYSWTVPTNWGAIAYGDSIEVTPTAVSGAISVVSSNRCGNSAPLSKQVEVLSVPQSPLSISGNDSICYNTSNSYQVADVTQATSYLWILPNGWTGSSTTKQLSLIPDISSGSLSVQSQNKCGISTMQSLSIRVKDIPAQPQTILGDTVLCLGSTNSFHIDSIYEAENYIWTLPSGWSGQSDDTSIVLTTGSTSGIISVAGSNYCGSSPQSSRNLTVIDIPQAPQSITGNTAHCTNSNASFSVASVPANDSILWQCPPAWTSLSHKDSIEVNVHNQSGYVIAQQKNKCGLSAKDSVFVQVYSIPGTPISIVGPDTLCANSTQDYWVSADSNVQSYIWTLPSGWTGSSLDSLIQVSTNSTNGSISVVASNLCGNSNALSKTLHLLSLPQAPALIDGPLSVCDGSTERYHVPSLNSSDSVYWTYPGSWTATELKDSIHITFSQNNGYLQANLKNACGVGPADSIAIRVFHTPSMPGSLYGPYDICKNSTITYAASPDSNVSSYIWTTPSGWTGSSTTDTLNVVATGSSGMVEVAASNLCGTSNSFGLYVTVRSLPNVSLNLTDTVNINQSTFALSGGNPTGGDYDGPGVINHTNFYPVNAGLGTHTISYTYTDQHGCSNMATDDIVVDQYFSLNSAEGSFGIHVYPNPCKDRTYIEVEEHYYLQDAKLVVYDMMGKKILEHIRINEQAIDLDVSTLKPGIYMIKLINRKQSHQVKLVVQ